MEEKERIRSLLSSFLFLFLFYMNTIDSINMNTIDSINMNSIDYINT